MSGDLDFKYLTTREFDRWATENDRKVDRILDAVEKQTASDTQLRERMATVEQQVGRSAQWSAVIATVVSALTGGLVGHISRN
jgi:hypothetical protein